MNYTLTFFGRTVKIGKSAFIVSFIAIAALSLFLVWCTFGGLYKWGGLAAIFAYVILFGEITINDVRKSLLPVMANRILGFPVTVAAIVYYWM